MQDGDEFRWATTVLDVNATNPGASAVTRTLTVPTGLRVQAIVTGGMVATSDGAQAMGRLSDLSLADQDPAGFPNIGGASAENSASSFAILLQSELRIWTNTSAQIRSRLDGSTAGTSIQIYTHGWVDRRGRDA